MPKAKACATKYWAHKPRQCQLGLGRPGRCRQRAARGLYSIKAQVANQGQITPGSVMTLSTVRSITQNANDGSLTLEVDGGKSIALSAVQRVGI